MAIQQKTILAFIIVFFTCHSAPAASAERAVPVFRIGLIGADPRQLVQDFDPFVDYLKTSLRQSGIRGVTVFVAKNLDQLSRRIQKGRLDFVLTSAFPTLSLERQELVPAVVALQEKAREHSAVFFVRNQSPLHGLDDLKGKTLVFATPWSTAGYALAVAELKKNNLSLDDGADDDAGAIRYAFAGEAINQAFKVIRNRADAGVFSSVDWEELPPQERSRLRVIHRTAPITSLIGSFHPAFPAGLRVVVEQELISMSRDKTGRAALAKALNLTAFERMTEEDRNALERLRVDLSDEADDKKLDQ